MDTAIQLMKLLSVISDWTDNKLFHNVIGHGDRHLLYPLTPLGQSQCYSFLKCSQAASGLQSYSHSSARCDFNFITGMFSIEMKGIWLLSSILGKTVVLKNSNQLFWLIICNLSHCILYSCFSDLTEIFIKILLIYLFTLINIIQKPQVIFMNQTVRANVVVHFYIQVMLRNYSDKCFLLAKVIDIGDGIYFYNCCPWCFSRTLHDENGWANNHESFIVHVVLMWPQYICQIHLPDNQ